MGENNVSAGTGLNEIYNSLHGFLPGIMAELNKQVLPTAQAQLAADKTVSPEYAKLQADIYKQYAPELSGIGDTINAASNMAAARSEADIADSASGQRLVDAYNRYQQQVDPEWTKQKAAISSGLDKYLVALGTPGQLTDTEREEMQRGLGARGFVNPRSALDAAENAMNFGSASKASTDRYGQGLAMATNMLPSLRSGVTGFEVATRRSLQPNSGTAATPVAATNLGQNAYNIGQNVLGILGGLQADNANREASMTGAVLGNVGKGFSIGGKLIGGIASGGLGGLGGGF